MQPDELNPPNTPDTTLRLTSEEFALLVEVFHAGNVSFSARSHEALHGIMTKIDKARREN